MEIQNNMNIFIYYFIYLFFTFCKHPTYHTLYTKLAITHDLYKNSRSMITVIMVVLLNMIDKYWPRNIYQGNCMWYLSYKNMLSCSFCLVFKSKNLMIRLYSNKTVLEWFSFISMFSSFVWKIKLFFKRF